MKALICLLLAALLLCPATAETVQDQALSFIQAAGIAADSVTRIGSGIIIPLADGGTASLWADGDFDPLQLGWRFEGASDNTVALYLDHALSLLLTMEQKIPADTENLSSLQKRIADSHALIVANGLRDLESTGAQGLRILLEKLSLEGESDLDSLRVRLASRLLDSLDNSPELHEGCEAALRSWLEAIGSEQKD